MSGWEEEDLGTLRDIPPINSSIADWVGDHQQPNGGDGNNEKQHRQLQLPQQKQKQPQQTTATATNPRRQEQHDDYHDHEHDDDNAYCSGVDGIGMWKSWNHNYVHPRFACYDLLDNAFDATLSSSANQNDATRDHDKFIGRVMMDLLASSNGITITNNSAKPIKHLRETLTAYRSQKNSSKDQSNEEIKKDAIGEYGVGLKQACATLTDTSFVLTKNTTTSNSAVDFQLGVIAESLQTRNFVSLPHFSFTVNMATATDSGSINEQIKNKLSQILHDNPYVHHLVTNTIGRGNRKDGVNGLVQQYSNLLLSDDWKHHPHVFQLLITNLILHSSASSQQQHNHPAKLFLEEIRSTLPKYYINVPLHNFEFSIRGKPVKFCYWQHRLVEMTKFEVYIPKDKPIHTLPDNGPWAQTGYALSIYCGFDALRLADRHQAKTCQLYIHSRQCGRLIEVIEDARDMINLFSSGSQYSQGLTVIIDDVSGELPLKPTKDGLTWSKDKKYGEIHQQNLFAWAGAVANMYWMYHTNLFKKRTKDFQSALSGAVLTFAEPIEARLKRYEDNAIIDFKDKTLERVEKAKFCMFSDVPWKKVQNVNTMKQRITKVPGCKLELWRENTPATVWKFNESHYPPLPVAEGELEALTPSSRKRRRTSASSSGSAASSSTNKKRGASSLLMIQFPSPSANPLAMTSPAGIRSNLSNQLDSFNSPRLPTAHNHQSPTRWQDVDHLNIKRLEDALGIKTYQVQELHSNLQQVRLQLMTPPQSASEQNAVLALDQLRTQNIQLQHDNWQHQEHLQQLQQAEQSVQVATQETYLLHQRKQQLEQQAVSAEQSLLAAQQETAKLKQQMSQVECSTQECQGSHNAELRKMELEMKTLNGELAKRERTIEQLSGGNGFVWGQGTDEI